MSRYYSKSHDITFRLTSREEERELFLKAHKGDEVAREFLIKNHLLFAMTQAKALTKGVLPEEDVVSAANYATMKAIDSFNPNVGCRFTTYVRNFIKGEVARLWKSKFSCGVLDPSALNTSGNSPSEKAAPTLDVPDESPTVEELDLKKFNRVLLAKALAKLPKRDAEFIRLYYVEDWSHERIGKRYRLTRAGVSAAMIRIKETLRRWLVREGIECAS